MKQTKAINNLIDGSTYHIRSNINCEIRSVVYCLECLQCNIRYFGGTSRRIKDKIREHVYGSSALGHFEAVHEGDFSLFSWV